MAILKHADFEVPGFGEFTSPPTPVPRYVDAISALNPLAYWRMGEASGATLADQADNHPLSLSGVYTLDQPGALDVDNHGAVFFDDGLAATVGAVLPTTASAAFTVAFWIRMTTSITKAAPIIGQFVAAGSGAVRFIMLLDGRVRYLMSGDADLRTSPVVDDTWRFLVFTRSASGTATWYVDGELDVQNTGHGAAAENTRLRIGASTVNVVPVFLDEVSVFDTDLSADQVRWLYGLGRANLALPPA